MGVKLEVFRMMLYLSFPVTMFWISNQPEYFEEYIVKRKREIYPPEKDDVKRQLQEAKEAARQRRENLYSQE
ncbi:protein PET100 homolog, mitochondrial [Rana temporaria]|uniref:protein PET100 homolog, mitochondrial n=1 Tax=Rana temporaria TaxID=8407 RepID=UPI001AADB4F3|nr:protein PET100 homolog, mitochondrial [Rana temporaria]